MESAIWSHLRDFQWATADTLIKVAIIPSLVGDLDLVLEQIGATRHYSAAGNVAYVDTDREGLPAIDDILTRMKLSGLALRGDIANPRLGYKAAAEAETTIQSAMDCEGKFLPL